MVCAEFIYLAVICAVCACTLVIDNPHYTVNLANKADIIAAVKHLSETLKSLDKIVFFFSPFRTVTVYLMYFL
jgi:hypothetical protein